METRCSATAAKNDSGEKERSTTWVWPSASIELTRVPVAAWYSGVVDRNTSSGRNRCTRAMVSPLNANPR